MIERTADVAGEESVEAIRHAACVSDPFRHGPSYLRTDLSLGSSATEEISVILHR